VEVSGIVKPPKLKRSRLAYAADAIGVERIIEAVEKRPARQELAGLPPLPDARRRISSLIARRSSVSHPVVEATRRWDSDHQLGVGKLAVP
jgi:hypothetical protein